MINQSRIESLQILRGIAASFVVFFHSVDNVARGKIEGNSFLLNYYNIFHVGAAGVDLFFCISGFIMIYIHREDFGRSKSSLKFMKKRIIRIVPVYWILTTLALVILIFAPKLSYHNRELEWGWVALSYFFIPCINKSGNGYPVLGLGWTLNFEMYFYICFAICLFFKKKYFITLISLYFIFSILLGFIIKFFHPFMLMTTSPMLIEFIFGCLIAEAYINNIKLQTYQSVILIFFSLFLLYYSSLFPDNTRVGFSRVLLWGIPTSFILSSFILSPTISGVKWSWIILMIGNASYSIYLIQVFTIPFIAKLVSQVGLSSFYDSNILVMFTGTIIIGIIFHHLIENKIIQWFKSP